MENTLTRCEQCGEIVDPASICPGCGFCSACYDLDPAEDPFCLNCGECCDCCHCDD